MISILQNLFPFIVVLTILVFVHELGHYLAARWNNVRVEVFSIGFGRELFGFTDSKGTRWRFSLIPIGGYVRMFGDADASSKPDPNQAQTMNAHERQYSLHGKKPWQKIIVSAAGPLANFLFAIIVLFGLFSLSGVPVEDEGVIIGKVLPGKAADNAGLKENDKIVGVDNKKISTFTNFHDEVSNKPNKRIALEIERLSNTGEINNITINLVPEAVKVDSQKTIGQIGVQIQKAFIYKKLPPLEAFIQSVKFSYDMCANMLKGIWEIITQKRSGKELGGIFTIGDMAGQSFKSGFIPLLMFMVLLSLNLGLINLLPIPMLDGGHIVFATAEMIKGKPISAKTTEILYFIGFAFVASLMLFALWNDIERYTNITAWIGKLRSMF